MHWVLVNKIEVSMHAKFKPRARLCCECNKVFFGQIRNPTSGEYTWPKACAECSMCETYRVGREDAERYQEQLRYQEQFILSTFNPTEAQFFNFQLGLAFLRGMGISYGS